MLLFGKTAVLNFLLPCPPESAIIILNSTLWVIAWQPDGKAVKTMCFSVLNNWH